ncbi:lanthionine synthetase C family protein [Streptomyces sp. NPDC057694]|uniref:lanthionine synthetase C family protein n=1 Tax=Streptomyces sp. NPDC057694 TaxID=3346216 RepID=UPI0036B306CA
MSVDDLGGGFAGTALYEMVYARAGGNWKAAHVAAKALNAQPVTAHPQHANLYRGAPAVAYVLHTAGHRAYARALAELDAEVVAIAADRLQAAEHRMYSRVPPSMLEYDLISGLTGLGAYLLHRGRDNVLEQVLRYLVRLITEPLTVDGQQVPGWWASTDPRGAPGTEQFLRGHANFGVAHGFTGPLALLALARRTGYTVAGHDQALAEGIAHLTRWAQPLNGGGTGWPECLPLDTFLKGPTSGADPGRPSWCYGTPGIGRALQLAALAVHDDPARRLAEGAVFEAVTDPRQLAQLDDIALCHGWAGLLLAADRIGSDAVAPDITAQLPVLRARFGDLLVRHEIPENGGLLSGNAGVLLTLHSLDAAHPIGWETCLLLD